MKVKVSKMYEKAASEVRKTDAYKRARVISDFTERICCRLEELGITQSELARRLGVTRAYVTNFLCGDVNFTFDTAVKISTALVSMGSDPVDRKVLITFVVGAHKETHRN